MARFKISAPPPTGEYGVEYVVNPSGTVWGVHENHPAPGWPRYPADAVASLVELAERREDGWRLATEDEIRKHAKDTGEWLPPELDAKAAPAPTKEAKEDDEPPEPTEPEAAGKAAAEAGKPKASNPYDGRSKDYRTWNAAYDAVAAGKA